MGRAGWTACLAAATSHEHLPRLPAHSQGRHRADRRGQLGGAAGDSAAVQPRFAHALAAGAGGQRGWRRSFRGAAPEGAAGSGIFAQLAALETMVYPSSGQLRANDVLAQIGTLEIVPMETPLALFVWSKSRILPVRVTEFGVTEEAFDAALNPIRAKVSLGLRVLSVNDVPSGHKAASLFMSYLQQKERLAGGAGGQLSALGLSGVP